MEVSVFLCKSIFPGLAIERLIVRKACQEWIYTHTRFFHQIAGGPVYTKSRTPSTSQTITAPGFSVTQTYSYDQVNRLASATETAASVQTWQQVYGYDVYGNRWVNASSYIPTPALTPQSQSAFNSSNNRLVSGLGYNYDLVGNVTKDPTTAAGAMVYDAENRQVSYTKAAVTTTYAYDGDGRRVKKVDSTGTTVFVYNAGGQLIAEYVENGGGGLMQMSYLTMDHLGSTRVVTDGAGVVKARHDYLPFGEEIGSDKGGRASVAGYAAVDSTRQRFTGQQRDTESGLDYFQARYYSASQGRFTSADTFGGSIPSPQTLNLYSYVQNNPLAFTDPTGHRSEPLSDKGDQEKLDWARKQGARHSGWFPGLKDWRIVESQDKDGKLVRSYVWDPNYIHKEGDGIGVGKDSGGGTRDYQYVDKWGRAIHLWGDPKKDPSQEADHGYAIVTADEEKPGQALYTQGHGDPPPSYVDYADTKKAMSRAGYVKVWDPEPSHRGGSNWVTQKSPTLHITLYPKHQIIPHQDCTGCPVTYTQRYVNQRSTFHVDRWTQGGTWKEMWNHLKEYFEK